MEPTQQPNGTATLGDHMTSNGKPPPADNHDGLTGWKLFRQVVMAVVVAMMTASTGAHSSVPSVMLPKLMLNSSQGGFNMSLDQGTWFASMHSLSAMLGSLGGGMCVHHLGPRRTLLLQSLPCIAGWVLMCLANDFAALLIARVLVGVSCGLSISASQVYLGEASSPQIRGRLVCISGLLNNTGSLVVYVAGYLLPWRWVPAMPVLLFALPSFIGMLFVPESPYWLVGRQRPEAARRSLRRLRGDDQIAAKELELIASATEARSKALTLRELAAEMRKLSVLAPFLTISALFVFRVMAGIMCVLTYAVIIFEETGSALGPYESAIVVGVVRLLDALSCVLYVSERFGRRPLLMFSGVGCTLATLGMAGFLFARDQAPLWPGWRHIYWLPLPCIVLFLIAFDLGYARTGWVVHSEILPNKVRAALSGPGVLIHFFTSFVSVFSFPYIRGAMTLAGAFLFFSMFSFMGLLLTIFFIPETKNKRLEVIEAFYVKRFGGHRHTETVGSSPNEVTITKL